METVLWANTTDSRRGGDASCCLREMRVPHLDRRQAVSASLLSLGVAPLSHWPAAATASAAAASVATASVAASEAWPLIGLGTCCEEPAEAAAQVATGWLVRVRVSGWLGLGLAAARG